VAVDHGTGERVVASGMFDGRLPDGRARLRDVGRVALAVAALAVAVAAVALVIMPPRAVAALPPSGPHLALAAWINAATRAIS